MTTQKLPQITTDPDHRPPLGEPTSGTLGLGAGAIIGGAVGAVAGAVGGPVTAIAGAALGAVAGGLTMETIEEAVTPIGDDAFWRSNFLHRPYVEPGASYEAYRSAYQYGWESRARHPGKNFDDVEAELARDWPRANSSLTWERGKLAARDAWERSNP